MGTFSRTKIVIMQLKSHRRLVIGNQIWKLERSLLLHDQELRTRLLRANLSRSPAGAAQASPDLVRYHCVRAQARLLMHQLYHLH